MKKKKNSLVLLTWVLILLFLWELQGAISAAATIENVQHYKEEEVNQYIEHDKLDITKKKFYAENGKLFVQQMRGLCEHIEITKKASNWFYYDDLHGILAGIPFLHGHTKNVTVIQICQNVQLHFKPEPFSHLVPSFIIYLKQQFDNIGFQQRFKFYSTFYLAFKSRFVIGNGISNPSGCTRNSDGEDGITRNRTPFFLPVYLKDKVSIDKIEHFIKHLTYFADIISGYKHCQFSSNPLLSWTEGSLNFFKLIDPRTKKSSNSLPIQSSWNISRRSRRSLDFFKLADPRAKRPLSESCIQNTPPVAKSNRVVVKITLNKFEHIRLNPDLFTDSEDGHAGQLQLHLKWANGETIKLTDWLQYTPMLQLAYAWVTYSVFVNQPPNGYKFNLTAVDSCDAATSMDFFIKIVSDVRPPCYAFVLLAETSMDIKTPRTHILTDIVSILSNAFTDLQLTRHLIQDLREQTFDKKNILSLAFSDQSISCNPCDYSKIKKIENEAKDNSKFHASLMPNFKYLGFTIKWDSCTGNSAPIVLYPTFDIQMRPEGVVHIELPVFTFYDAEDEFAPNLKLTIAQPSTSPVIAFMDGLNVFIYQANSKGSDSKQMLVIEALDENQNAAKLQFNVYTNHQLLTAPGYFKYRFFTYYDHQTPGPEILRLILKLFSEYQQEKTNYGSYIILNYSKAGMFPQIIDLSFARKEFYSKTSGYQAFVTMRNKLFYNNKVANQFTAFVIRYIREIEGSFYDQFAKSQSAATTTLESNLVKKLIDSQAGGIRHPVQPSTAAPLTADAVTSQAPVARYQIGPFKATFCDFFVFPIPEDLFLDKDDGNTRNLRITLADLSNKPVDKTSWILVDSNIQVIYGYLKIQDYIDQGGKNVFYNLVATNAKGLSTSLLFRVDLPEKLPDILYTVTMTITPFFQESVPEINEQLLILTKISAYFGQPSRFSWINIISFNRNSQENKITVAWTNCTLPGTKCHSSDVTAIASKLVLSKGVANTNFARFLSPQYIIHDISASTSSACYSTSSLIATTSSVISATFPVIVSKIPTLRISTLQFLRYKIPFNTFYDSADGYTPYLTLSMSYPNGQQLTKSSWIQFNSAAQEITAFLYVDVMQGLTKKKFEMVLTATNSFNRATNLAITIDAARDIAPIGGAYVSLTGTEFFSITMNDIQVLTLLLVKYFQYVGVRYKTEISTFKRGGQQGLSTFELRLVYHRFTNAGGCNRTDINLLQRKLLTETSQINPNFQMAFSPQANPSHVTFTRFGVCLNNPSTTPGTKSPMVLNPISKIMVTNAGFFQYAIPRQTFFDPTDGYTPYLKLELLNEDKVTVQANLWFTLSTNQVLIASPSRQEFPVAKEFTFYLRATNKKNLFVDMVLQIRVTTEYKPNMLEIKLTSGHRFQSTASNVDIIVYSMEKLNSYLYSKTNRKETLLISFTRQTSKFSIVVADKSITKSQCNGTVYLEIYRKLFSPSGSINHLLLSEFNPSVTVTSIQVINNCQTTTPPPSTTTPASNKPPYVNKAILPIQISFGRLIFTYFNSKTFLDDEDGDTKSLTLSFLKKSGQNIGPDSWIQLNSQFLLLYGAYSLVDFDNLKPSDYEFILQASDSQGATVSTPVRFIPPDRRLTYSFKMATVISMFYQGSSALVNEQILFVTKMNSLFSKYTFIGIQLITFIRNLNTKRLHIEWTLDNLNSQTCPHDVLDKVTTLFITNGAYINAMKPEYTVYSVVVNRLGPCTMMTLSPSPSSTKSVFSSTIIPTTPTAKPPVVNTIIPPLSPKQCSVFIYYIPSNAFLDPNDGTSANLQLDLLTSTGKSLDTQSWINFNKERKYIYGVMSEADIKASGDTHVLVYRLQASNSAGSAYSYVTVRVPSLQQKSLSVKVIVTTQNTIHKKADLTIMLIGKISTFLRESGVTRVISASKMQGNFWTVDFTACEGLVKYCNAENTDQFKSSFFTNGGMVNVAFRNHLKPEINILQGFFTREPCTIPTTNPPTTNPPTTTTTSTIKPNNPPIILQLMTTQTITRCQPLMYQIPDQSFFDPEDGLTRNLKISLLKENGELPGKDTWISLDERSQTIKGALTAMEVSKFSELIYRVVATDKEGLSVYQYLRIKVEDPKTYLDSHMVNMYGSVYSDISNSNFRLLVHQNFTSFLKQKLNPNLLGFSIQMLTFYPTNPKTVHFKWSLCQRQCITVSHDKLKEIILSDGSVRTQVKILLQPHAIITTAVLTQVNDCSPTLSSTFAPMSSSVAITTPTTNTPPIIRKSIPVLTIKTCSQFRYEIPENTCYDKEDGFTPKLSVKLLRTNNTEVGHRSWIHLNEATQTIYGLLKITDIESSVNQVFVYHLVCIDRGGLSVSQSIYLLLQESPKMPSYHFVMKSYIYVDASASDAEVQFLWLKKIKRYFNENKDNIQLISYTRSTILHPQIVIKWYNCSIIDPCSTDAIALRDSMFNLLNHKSINPIFSQAMVPEFVMISGSMQTTNTCQPESTTPHPPTTSTPKPDNKIPIAIIKNLTIHLDPCVDLVYQIPVNTFFDAEDGYTRNLRLDLTLPSGGTIDDPCISFDVQTQTVYGRYVIKIFRGDLVLKLTAHDKYGASTYSNVRISVNDAGNVAESSHWFVLRSYVYDIVPEKLNILKSFKSKLQSFFNNVSPNQLLFKDLTYSSNYMEVIWANCTLIKQCSNVSLTTVTRKMFLYDSIINSEFIAALAPSFVLTDVEMLSGSLCQRQSLSTVISPTLSTSSVFSSTVIPTSTTNTPPTVTKQIPVLEVKLCSLFSYRIPEDIFYDKEDGNTRNLRIELRQFNDQTLSKSSWLQFVGSTQVVYGHVRLSDIDMTEHKYINFLLRAYDRMGLNTFTVLTLKLPVSPPISYYIETTSARFFDGDTPNLIAQIFLASKISTYSNDQDISNVLVMSFERDQKSIKMTWTNCSLGRQPCNNPEAAHNIRSFVDDSGKVNTRFQSALAPYYTIASIDVNRTNCNNAVSSSTIISPSPSTTMVSSILPTASVTINQPPRLNRRLPQIKIKLCGTFSFTLPADTFLDEDGNIRSLKIQLFNIYGKEVDRRESWVQYNEKLFLIYGLVKRVDVENQPNAGYRYIMKATDSQELSSSTVVSFSKLAPLANVGFSIIMEIKCSFNTLTPFLNDIFQIINKIIKFFGDNNVEPIKVIDFQMKPGTLDTVIFTWTNCTLDFTACPAHAIASIRKMITTGDAFYKVFEPSYTLKMVSFRYTYPCQEPITTTPRTTTTKEPTNSPTIRNYIQTIITKECSVLSYQIPELTFYDEEDGWTRKLSLDLTFVDDKPIPASYWVQFNRTSQMIIGYPNIAQKIGNTPSSFIFNLIARDKDNNKAALVVRIDVEHPQQADTNMHQNYTLRLKHNFPIQTPNEDHFKKDIFERISQFYGDKHSSFLIDISFKNQSGYLEISWTNCSMISKTCNATLALLLKNHIADVNGKCRSQFAFVFLPEYTIEWLRVDTASQCLLTVTPTPSLSTAIIPSSSIPPTPSTIKVLVPEITIQVTYCKHARLTIPENIFYDERDGNSRFFSYQLLYTDFIPVSCQSWLQLNQTQNLIYGSVLQAQLTNPLEYRLRAGNAIGSTATTMVRIDTSQIKTVNVTYRAAFSFQTNLPTTVCDADLLALMKQKLVTYFGDDTDEYISFIYFSRGVIGQRSYVMWRNCTINPDICDFKHINYISSKLFYNESSVPNEDLVNALSPEFTDISVLDQKLGPCSRNKVLAVGLEPTPYCIKTCGIFRYKLEEAMFHDPEDGNTSKLIIEVTHTNYSPLEVNSWIQFDADTNTLFGFSTESVIQNEPKDGYKYLITAFDSGGAAASVIVTFKICMEKPSFDSSFAMNLKCNRTITKAVHIAGQSLKEISDAYLDGSLHTFFVVNFQAKLNTLNLTFANCTGSGTFSLEQINKAFGNDSDCVPTNITYNDHKDYPPKPNKVDIRFKISFCQPINYTIPDNVITDAEDGDLRNLTVYLAYQNLKPVPLDYFVAIDREPDSSLNLIFLATNETRTRTIYEYYLVGKDGRNQTATVQLFLEVLDNFPEVNFGIGTNFRVPDVSLPHAVHIQRFLKRFTLFLRSNETWKILSYKVYSNNTYMLKFSACSLSYPECSYTKVDVYTRAIVQNNGLLNPDLATAMFPTYIMEDAQTIKYGECLLDPNTPPKALATLNLTVTRCGFTTYQIPKDTFHDLEDGDTRSLTVHLLFETNCWLKFISTKQEMIILHDTVAAAKQPRTGYILILQATDSRGESVNTTLNITFAESKQVSFQAVIIFEIRQAKFECLEEKFYIMQKLLQAFNTSNELTLSGVSKSTDNSLLQVIFENCTMRYSPCDFLTVNKMVAVVQNGSFFDREFLRTFSADGIYKPKYFTQQKLEPCLDRSNKKPIVNGTLSRVNVSGCEQSSYHKLPLTLVTDPEDGDWSNMRKKLVNTSINLPIPGDSWITLSDESMSLVIPYIREIAMQQPVIGYQMHIQVTDSRGEIVNIPFTVNFNQTFLEKSFTVTSKIPNTINVASSLVKFKEELELNLSLPIELISYRLFANNVSIEWTICSNNSEECPRQEIHHIENYFRNMNKVIELKKFGTCLISPPGPPTGANLTIQVDPCHKLSYPLPSDIFEDDKDSLKDLTIISVKQAYPTEENITFIKFNETNRTFEGGLRAEVLEKYRYFEYQITAMDTDNFVANATIRFVLKDVQRQFNYKFRVEHYLDEVSSEPLLEKFCLTLVSYLGEQKKGLLLYNIKRVRQSLPEYDISVTPCSLTGNTCDGDKEVAIVGKLFSTKPDLSAIFIQSMLRQNILPKQLEITDLKVCTKNELTNKTVTLKVAICNTQTFGKDQLLGTVNSTYELDVPVLPWWMEFNQTLQYLSVKPTLSELQNQPTDGIPLIFNVLENNRVVSKQNVSVHIEGDVKEYNFMLIFNISGNFSGNSNLNLTIDIQKRINTITKETKFSDAVIADVNFSTDKVIVYLYGCTLDIKYCQVLQNQQFTSLFVEQNQTTLLNVQKAFGPEYQIESIKGLKLNRCKELPSDHPYITGDLPELNISLCTKLQYVVPKGLFMDQIDGEVSGNQIKFINSTGQIVGNDGFIHYEYQQRIIYGLMTQEQIEMSVNKVLIYYLVATNSRNNSVNATLKIHIPEVPPNNLLITTTTNSYQDPTLPTFMKLLNVCRRLEKYLKPHEALSIVKLTRSGTFPQEIVVVWTTCSLIGNTCSNESLSNITGKIFVNGADINPQYRDALGSNLGFIHKKTTMKKLNNCLHPGGNENPISNKNVSLVVRSCGNFEKRLDNEIFIDKENGDITNLTLKLQFLNGTDTGEDYWLSYDDDTKTLFGMMTDAVRTETTMTFLIEAIDIGNGRATGYLYVYLNESSNQIDQDLGKVTATVQCQEQKNRRDISNIIKVLNLTVTTMDASIHDIRLKTYYINETMLLIEWTSCVALNLTLAKQTVGEKIDSCQIVKVVVEKPDKPVVRNSIDKIVITCGYPKLFKIPENTFEDNEGTTTALSLEVLDSTRQPLDSMYMSFDKGQQTIMLFVSIKDCEKAMFDRFYFVQAKDSDNNTVLSTLTIEKFNKTVSCCMYINMEFTNVSSINDTFNIFSKLTNGVYSNNQVDPVLVDISKDSSTDKTIGVYTDSKLTNSTCHRNNTNLLTKPVFSDVNNTIVLQSIKNQFSEYNLNSASTTSLTACNETGVVVPPVIPVTSALTGDEFISSSDWFLYLIPLFILAFMLLMCCICFYCCRYCYYSWVSPNRGEVKRARPRRLQSPVPYSTLPRERGENVDDDDYPDAGPVILADTLALPIDNPGGEAAPSIADVEAAPRALPRSRSNSTKRKKTISQMSSIHEEFVDQQEHEAEMDFQDRFDQMYAQPERLENTDNTNISVMQQRTMQRSQDTSRRLVASRPVTTSYTARSFSDSRAVTTNQRTTARVDTRRNLRLPAIPSGPPPPYSPPRFRRIIRQNILPSYYDRYLRHSKRIPISRDIITEPRRTILLRSPSPKRIISLPVKRRRKEERVVTPVITIPESYELTSSTPSDDSSIEMKAIIKGKQHSIQRLLQKSPIQLLSPVKRRSKRKHKRDLVEIPLTQTLRTKTKRSTDSPLLNVSRESKAKHHSTKTRHKFTMPYLYDYIPVKRRSVRRSKRYLQDTKKGQYSKLSRKQKTKTNKEKPSRKLPTLEELLDESLDINDEVEVNENSNKKNRKKEGRRLSVESNGSWIDIKDINLKT